MNPRLAPGSVLDTLWGMILVAIILMAVISPAILLALHLASEPLHGQLRHVSRHQRYTHNGTRKAS